MINNRKTTAHKGKEVRSIQVKVMFSEIENEKLKTIAYRANISKAEVLRELLLKGEIKEAISPIVIKKIANLNKFGSNLNQLVVLFRKERLIKYATKVEETINSINQIILNKNE